jgi:isoquinoline 1-oxidoreductase beta subunit
VDLGNVEEVLTAAAKRIEADYEFPFQAHATMEPMNTTVHVRDDGQIDVWSPTQIPAIAQETIAALAGVAPEKVNVELILSGGSFGRRYQWDYFAEAYQVAKNLKVPVQLVWTREDDMQHDFYLQYSFQRMRAALEEDGRIAAWWYREVTTPISTVFQNPDKPRAPKDVVGSDRNGETPYDAANYRADYAPVSSVVPRAWWRAVSAPFQIFAIESFIDELAHAAGKDPNCTTVWSDCALTQTEMPRSFAAFCNWWSKSPIGDVCCQRDKAAAWPAVYLEKRSWLSLRKYRLLTKSFVFCASWAPCTAGWR